MTTTKKTLLATALLAALGAANYAQAGQIIGFDPTGSGIFTDIITLDWAPGNALAQDAVNIDTLGDTFQLYYQTQLSNIFAPDGTTEVSFTGEFTLQMAFRDEITSITPGAPPPDGAGATFSLGAGGTNFLKIYYDDTPDVNTTTGTGFDNGLLIWEGVVTSDESNYTINSLSPPPAYPLLDNFGVNNLGQVFTLTGSGSGVTGARATSWNANFFEVAPTQIFLSLFNSSYVTPFNQQQPSASVVGQTPDYGVAPNNQTVTVNGFGNADGSKADFHFQADANQSFVVPEPTSLALLGLGLVGLGFGGRRRRA